MERGESKANRGALATAIEETGWTKAIETGLPALDDQHRQYFAMVNGYMAASAKAAAQQNGHEELVERLKFLRRYAVEHFATEQKIMKDAGYPDYQEHFEQHMYFLKRVGALDNRLREEGHSEKLTREVHFYTLEWFISHIQSADMLVVEFLRESGYQVAPDA